MELMSTREAQAIPYEKQAEGPSNRACGAAALSMVYRSLAAARAADGRPGLGDVSQDAIWARISKADRAGGLNCATHLMVKDALGRGLSAVALQATDPLRMLLRCHASGIHAILNHRLRPSSPAGHYTVLVGMDEAGVTVHDPAAGPSQRIPFGQLLELWQPRLPGSEIVGNVLIAIADDPPRVDACASCSVPIPAEAPCPQCKAGVPLAPSALVGCVGASCVNRSWLRVCCPSCDYTFPFVGAGADEPPAAVEGLWNLGPLFTQLDKFQAHIRSLPGIADRDDVKEQLALIDRKKVELRLAEHEEIARRKVEETQVAEKREAFEKEAEEIRKAQEAATSPAAPLDGNALAADLLKSLGIVK